MNSIFGLDCPGSNKLIGLLAHPIRKNMKQEIVKINLCIFGTLVVF